MAAVAVSLPQGHRITSLEEIFLFAISNDLRLLESLVDPEHDRELDAMIALGWGSTPQCEIPPDWFTRRGPERIHSADRKQAISRGMQRRRVAQGCGGSTSSAANSCSIS